MKKGIFLLPLVLFACHAASPSQQVAESFLDAYYVRADLTAAATFAEGYAQSKIEEGKVLTAGQTIDATTRQPHIYFKLLKTETAGPDEINYLYQLTIEPPKAPKILRQTYLKVRQVSGVWKVALFREL